jgi:hypothetical protein
MPPGRSAASASRPSDLMGSAMVLAVPGQLSCVISRPCSPTEASRWITRLCTAGSSTSLGSWRSGCVTTRVLGTGRGTSMRRRCRYCRRSQAARPSAAKDGTRVLARGSPSTTTVVFLMRRSELLPGGWERLDEWCIDRGDAGALGGIASGGKGADAPLVHAGAGGQVGWPVP